MNGEKIPLQMRRAREEDLPFIASSWLNSFRKSLFARSIRNSMYFFEHHKVIVNILNRAEVLCAVATDDPEQIYGYICGEFSLPIPVIHFIYVKHSFRRLGVGRELVSHIPKGPCIYTHDTSMSEKILPRTAIYSPYYMFRTAS